MGESLYGDPSLCIRELLQNALDALEVRDLRLKMLATGGEPYEPVDPPRFVDGKPQELRVTLTWGKDEVTGQDYLLVADNGVGMTEEVITQYFTQVGKSYYRSPEYHQERAALAVRGLISSPISIFGIGILSCFMIADRLQVRTCPGGANAADRLQVRTCPGGANAADRLPPTSPSPAPAAYSGSARGRWSTKEPKSSSSSSPGSASSTMRRRSCRGYESTSGTRMVGNTSRPMGLSIHRSSLPLTWSGHAIRSRFTSLEARRSASTIVSISTLWPRSIARPSSRRRRSGTVRGSSSVGRSGVSGTGKTPMDRTPPAAAFGCGSPAIMRHEAIRTCRLIRSRGRACAGRMNWRRSWSRNSRVTHARGCSCRECTLPRMRSGKADARSRHPSGPGSGSTCVGPRRPA